MRRSGSQVALLILSILAFLGAIAELTLGFGAHFAQPTVAGIIGTDVAATLDKVWVFTIVEGLLLFFMGITGTIASRNARRALPAVILSTVYIVFVIFVEMRTGNDLVSMFTTGNINLSLIGTLVFSLLYDGFAYAVRQQGKAR